MGSPAGVQRGANRYEERAHAAAVTLERGAVWHREHKEARKVVNDTALFPNGAKSEIAKSVIQALLFPPAEAAAAGNGFMPDVQPLSDILAYLRNHLSAPRTIMEKNAPRK